MAACGNHRPTVGGQGGIFAGDLRQLWGYMRQGICARQSGLWASSTPSARKGYIRRYMRRAWICAFGISLKACLLQRLLRFHAADGFLGARCVGCSCLCTKVPVPLMHEVYLAASGEQLTEHLLVPCLLPRCWQRLHPFRVLSASAVALT